MTYDEITFAASKLLFLVKLRANRLLYSPREPIILMRSLDALAAENAWNVDNKSLCASNKKSMLRLPGVLHQK